MTAPALFKQYDAERLLKAAAKCGFDEARVRVTVDGVLELIVSKVSNDRQEPVELD